MLDEFDAKPCPNCGSHDISEDGFLDDETTPKFRMWAVSYLYCRTCGHCGPCASVEAVGGIGFSDAIHNAVLKWNGGEKSKVGE